MPMSFQARKNNNNMQKFDITIDIMTPRFGHEFHWPHQGQSTGKRWDDLKLQCRSRPYMRSREIRDSRLLKKTQRRLHIRDPSTPSWLLNTSRELPSGGGPPPTDERICDPDNKTHKKNNAKKLGTSSAASAMDEKDSRNCTLWAWYRLFWRGALPTT